MITLTISTDEGEVTKNFYLKTVRVGSDEQPKVDLALPKGTPPGTLFEISVNEGSYTLANLGAENSLMLNNQVVEREFLQAGDSISTGGINVRFSAQNEELYRDDDFLVEDKDLADLISEAGFLNEESDTHLEQEQSGRHQAEPGQILQPGPLDDPNSFQQDEEGPAFEEYATLDVDLDGDDAESEQPKIESEPETEEAITDSSAEATAEEPPELEAETSSTTSDDLVDSPLIDDSPTEDAEDSLSDEAPEELEGAAAEPEKAEEAEVQAEAGDSFDAEIDIDRELSELSELFGGADLESELENVQALELSDEDIDALVQEAEKYEDPPTAAEEETETEIEDNQDSLIEQAAEEPQSPSEELTETGNLDEEDDELLWDPIQESDEPSASATAETPPETVKAQPEADSSEEEESNEELILDFSDDEVDSELDALIQEKASQASDVEAIIVDTNESEESGSEDEWTAIEKDIIEAHDPSKSNQSLAAPAEDSGSSPRTILALVAALLICIVGGVWMLANNYLERSNSQSELLAARQLADASMAVLGAQVYHGYTLEDISTNTELLLDGLDIVLSTDYRGPRRPINNLLGPDYGLQLLPDTGKGRFIILAKPHSTWQQFIKPKAGFIIDSANMHVRREPHPEVWENLFGNETRLELTSEEQLYSYFANGNSMLLSQLEGAGRASGFSIPKDLTYLLSDAESIVYYAPRYYPFTEKVVDQLTAFAKEQLTEHQKTILKRTLVRLKNLPGLVLYTSQGNEIAGLARQTLKDRFPSELNFLLGFLTVDSQDGYIQRSEVLMDEETFHQLQVEGTIKQDSSLHEEVVVDLDFSDSLNTNHPLYVALAEIAAQRTQALQEISGELVVLINRHNQKESAGFSAELGSLLSRYRDTSDQHREKISKVLADLYSDYVAESPEKNLPIYLASVKAHDLAEFLPEHIQSSAPAEEEVEQSEVNHLEAVQAAIEEIPSVQTLQDLHTRVRDTTELISASGIALDDVTEELPTQLRSAVLQAVSHLLLSPSTPLSKQAFNAENRLVLADILNLAQISEEEERNFYLEEFDLLVDKFRRISHEEVGQLRDLDEQLSEILEGGDRLMPEYKADLEQQKKQTEERILQSRAQIDQIKKSMQIVPLETPVASAEEQLHNYGRLGQQILIHESTQPPSVVRDDKLLEAIGLLHQSTKANRALWQDILEARRLLTETPKQMIEEVIESNLGFSRTRNPLSSKVRKDFKQYLNAKKSLSKVRGSEQLATQYSLFKEANREILKQVIDNSKLVQNKSQSLMQAYDQYIERLQQFQASYTEAQQEGFFVSMQSYHSYMLSSLGKHISKVESFRERIHDASTQMAAAAREHQLLAETELAEMADEAKVSPAVVGALLDRHNSIIYPNVLAENFSKKLSKLLNLKVYPIPQ